MLQNSQVTDEQKHKIARCGWLEAKLREIENSEPQQRIDSLLEQLHTSQNGHKESLRELFAEQAVNAKLREQLKSFKYQASSPYNQQIRNQWRNVSIAAGVILTLSVIVNVWMAVQK